MDEELKAFIIKNRKRKSVFDDFKDEIFVLVENEVSQENIVKYIKKKVGKDTKGLSQPNLSEWLKRQKKRNKLGSKKSTLNETDKASSKDDQEQSGGSKFQQMMDNAKE